MTIRINYSITFSILFLLLFTSGCAGQQSRAKSSIVDYLYPKESNFIVEPSIPTLHLPLKVGIAFVPGQQFQARGVNIWSGATAHASLTEGGKVKLLEKVAKNFRQYDFVKDIEVIPSQYLTPEGSFANLEQIKTMYGIDIIALVSYDQTQFTDEGFLSLSYWTLVGAYVISGEKNDTSTMMDTAVYDIQSKKMLFRAPGTSQVKGSSTPINLSEELRQDSIQSFNEASKNMVKNLDMQLQRFREKVKQDPQTVKIIHREGYGGGGSISLSEITVMTFLLTCLYRRRRS